MADEGLTAPGGTFTFQITAEEKAGETVSAVLTTPAAGEGGQEATQDTTVVFNEDGVATVELTAGQSIELQGMAGVDYEIRETELPEGFRISNVEGADEVDNETHTASGAIAVGADDESVTFTNNYSVASTTTAELGIDLDGTKTINGRDFQEGDTFTFRIAAAQATPDAPLPTEDMDNDGSAATATITPASGNSASFGFGDITFTEPGEYRYIITEVNPADDGDEATSGIPGMAYDTVLYRMNIVIADKGDGTLGLLEVSGENPYTSNLVTNNPLVYTSNPMLQVYTEGSMQSADEVAFENTFSATETTAAIRGTKTLDVTDSDRRLGDGDFSFTITALGSNMDGGDEFAADSTQPMPANNTVSNVANGDVIFGSGTDVMTFTQDMVGKTYGYQIAEVIPEDAQANGDGTYTLNGVTYQQNVQTVKITVGLDEDNVTAVVTPNTNGVNFAFTNSYEPTSTTIGGDSGNEGIAVQKTFTGRDWTSDHGFTFDIKAVSNTAGIELSEMPMPEGSSITIANPASGTVNTGAFGEMTFEKADTYVYEVTERDTSHGGVTYDTHAATVTVTVTEDGATGTLSASVSYDNSLATTEGDRGETGAAAFTNTYSADNTAPLPDITETRNESSGAVSFGNISYDIGDMEGAADNGDGTRTKVFTYTVTESGSVTGVTNDQTASRTFTVTLTDDGQGNITAVSSETPGAQFIFTNSYNLTPQESSPTGEGGITITKNLEGRGLNEGEFSFVMQGVAGTASEDMRSSGVNAADGTVSMSSVTFNAPGTYQFVIYEVDNNLGGVDYDTARYNAKADVSDEGDGTLSVTWSFTDGEDDPIEAIAFDNSYSAAPTSVTLGAVKSLDGRALNEGEFSFELKDADGNVLQTKENDTEGAVAFDSIIFDQPGTYTYTVSEVKGDDSTITYDETVYTAIITVTDDLSGHLAAEVTDGDGNALSMTFANKYTEPVKDAPADSGPTSTGVRTGDTAAVLPLVIAMAAALVVTFVLGAAILRRRRR